MGTLTLRERFPHIDAGEVVSGVVYGIAFVVGVVMAAMYVSGGMSAIGMGETTLAFAFLTGIFPNRSRISWCALALGGIGVWISLDPVRDLVSFGLFLCLAALVATLFLCLYISGVVVVDDGKVVRNYKDQKSNSR